MYSVGFMGDSGQNPSALLLCGRRLCVVGYCWHAAPPSFLLLPPWQGWAVAGCPSSKTFLSSLGVLLPWPYSWELGKLTFYGFQGFMLTTASGGFLHHPLGLEGPFQMLGVKSLTSTYPSHNPWNSPSWHRSKAFPLACWTTGSYLVETRRCETEQKGLKSPWADLVA